MNTDLIHYYKERAKEYEDIYSRPERQEDIRTSAKILRELFTDKRVFEIACGTGFWTKYIAESAHSVLATDINLSVIEIARQKEISNPRVSFEVGDLYQAAATEQFESVFGGFIWSHIPKQELDKFFDALEKFVLKNSTIVLMDNLYVEGSNHPVTETDPHGNTYQTRKLKDGSSHKVLKNFATESFMRDKLKNRAEKINFIQLEYFWILTYSPV